MPPQSTYVFKHALIQDAAYESLLKSTKQHYHQCIAQVLEFQFPETVEGQPELLAHHYTKAGLAEKAVHYWDHAGQSAVQRSAHVEASAHLRQGLALLETLPVTPERTRREVDMLLSLEVALNATKGYGAPEVEQTLLRAQHLCAHLEAPRQLFTVMRRLANYYTNRAELQTAHALGKQLLALAQHVQDAAILMRAHYALGQPLYHLGAVASAHTHFAQGIALYEPQQHPMLVFLHAFAARTLWYLGYPDQALTRNQEAVTLAQQSASRYNLGIILSWAALFHQFRREVRVTQEHAEAAIRLAKEQGVPSLRALGSVLRGWALVQQRQVRNGIEQITQGLTAWRATGTEIGRPYWLALLAEAYGTMGQPEAGLTALAEALTLVDTTGERAQEPDLYRLKGALLLQQHTDNQAEAETCFQHAISLARSQQAKCFELRAATSLARLWQQQGKREEAHDLLAPVYNWFTEGFDTADLQEAKALLDALA
jgi:tetratricopeptide (TPR) repeat protein